MSLCHHQVPQSQQYAVLLSPELITLTNMSSLLSDVHFETNCTKVKQKVREREREKKLLSKIFHYGFLRVRKF